MKSSLCTALLLLAATLDNTESAKNIKNANKLTNPYNDESVPCSCAIFLNGQFKKGSPPTGNPALVHEQDTQFPCNALGIKQCQNKCLEAISKHLHNSPTIICGSIDRDCHREKAYLFVQNCNETWVNTNLSAGREFCCKDGVPQKCKLITTE